MCDAGCEDLIEARPSLLPRAPDLASGHCESSRNRMFTCFPPRSFNPNDFNHPKSQASRFANGGSVLVVQGVSQGRRGCLARPLHPVAPTQAWFSRSYSVPTSPPHPPHRRRRLPIFQLLGNSTVVLVQDKQVLPCSPCPHQRAPPSSRPTLRAHCPSSLLLPLLTSLS